MDYQVWLDSLTEGSPVLVRHPWEDRGISGGRTEPATVTKVSTHGIHIEGVGVFHWRTGRASPYLCLEQPDYKPPTLPVPVLPSYIDQYFVFWRHRNRYAHSFALRITDHAILLCRYLPDNWYQLYVWAIENEPITVTQPTGGETGNSDPTTIRDTREGTQVAVSQFGGGLGFQASDARLLIETGHALEAIDLAAQHNKLEESLIKMGFNIIHTGEPI